MCVWCGPPIPQACPIRRVTPRKGVWGGSPSDTSCLWGTGEGQFACLPSLCMICSTEVWRCHELCEGGAGRWCPKGHSLCVLCPSVELGRCPERTLSGRYSRSLLGMVVAPVSRWPCSGGASGFVRVICPRVGPGLAGLFDRWSRRRSRESGDAAGEPGRVLPQHTRGASTSRPLLGGETSLPWIRPGLCPLGEVDSAREAVLESLVELNHTGT